MTKNFQEKLNKISFKNKGAFIQIIPTYYCSLKCEYCFTRTKYDKLTLIPLDQYKHIIQDLVKNLISIEDFSLFEINFLGGELSEIENIMDYFKIFQEETYKYKDKISVKYITNGLGNINHYLDFLNLFENYLEYGFMVSIHYKAFAKKEIIISNLATILEISKKEQNLFLDTMIMINTKNDKINSIQEKFYKELQKLDNLDIEYNKIIINTEKETSEISPKIKPGIKLCWGNYFIIRPEGIENKCSNEFFSLDSSFSNFSNLQKPLLCMNSFCPCSPYLNKLSGFKGK